MHPGEKDTALEISEFSAPVGSSVPQQLQRIDLNKLGDLLQRAKGEVALAAFQAAHIGAVDTDDVSKGLLTETSLETEGS